MNKILKTKEINAELNYIVSNLYNFSTNSIKLKKRGKELAHQITDNYLTKNDLYYVFKFKGKNLNKLKDKIILFSSFFGKTVGQNFKNEKFIEVSPDKKKIQKYKKIQDEKLRYHQTNKGGSIHTDGPQLNLPPKILIMGCLNNKVRGGHTILVNGMSIFGNLKKKYPNLVSAFKKNFYFERRGFQKKNKYLLKPIFENKNSFKMRYLSEYITTAYKNKNLKLSKKKRRALEALNRELENKKNQRRLKMQRGDIILINNHIIAHGRTSFSIDNNNKRKLLRIWTN